MIRIALGVVLVHAIVVPVQATEGSVPFTTNAAQNRILTFEDRVAAQRAIEGVYWRHRTWPKENTDQKPSLSAVMPDVAIRAKVENYLKLSNALEERWHRPITGEQLQAEVNRMARDTHDPRILRELFEALGDDEVLVAETLGRQVLAERLSRDLYGNDRRFHGDLKRSVEAALASCHDVACLKSLGGDYSETNWMIRGAESDVVAEPRDAPSLSLGIEEWKRQLDRLTAKLGGSPEMLPLRKLGPLEETDDEFIVVAVLSQSRSKITTAAAAWRKRPFDIWWRTEKERLGVSIEQPSGSFELPAINASNCIEDTWSPTRTDVPDGRSSHSAVWTGTEMIVWGGATGAGALNTGARYDPATDTWTATSVAAGVPAPRAVHTAVWTGTEMIVWGGHSNNSRLNTGGRYDPSTDTWAATSTGANVPLARDFHTAVWTGTEMIVWGGLGPPGLNSGGRYDPIADHWTPTSTGANVPSPRESHTAIWTGTEMIVWSGSGASGRPNTGGRYDPITDAWTPISTGANVPAGRFGHTAIWSGTEMIVWGGWAETGLTNTGGRYDPATDAWSSTSTGANVPSRRYDHTAVWTGTEMIVWGNGANSTGGRYSPATDTWLPTSTAENVPSVRANSTAIWTGTEMIVWGGDACGGTCPLHDGGRYDPTADRWTATSIGTSTPLARSEHAALWTGAEMMVWGGSTRNGTVVATGGRYDPATDSWTPTAIDSSTPSARWRPTAVWTGLEMIVWGGGSSVGTVNDGGRYNPLTDRWAPTSTGANVPAPRASHTAIWTGRAMIVWGGSGNTGGRYFPATDTWLPTSTGANVPPPRSSHTAVWTGREMIVWGGGATLNSGGRYDPSTDSWMATSIGPNVPVGRYYHTAVWTGTEMIVWGGYSTSVLNTGGRYDPLSDAWTAISTGSNVPSPRAFPIAVWTGAQMIVWGGTQNDGSPFPGAGALYDPSADSWVPTTTLNAPAGRQQFGAVWTGTEMIVWGGYPYTSTGGRYCGCPQGRIFYRDVDGDGYGSAGISTSSCDGSSPAGVVENDSDCDDSHPNIHPDAPEVCNGIDDDCDGLVDEDASGEDVDGDGMHDLCDNCVARSNGSQTDSDHDGEGDACDLDDDSIWEWRDEKTTVSWQPEQGPTSWNVYIGDLGVLKETGVYTQSPGSNTLADRRCGETATSVDELGQPALGQVSFSLVSGVTSGIEGSLGSSSSGPRPNASPCP